MDNLEKNLLDLRHSLYNTQGALYLSVGIAGGLALFFGSLQLELSPLTAFFISIFFSLPFISISIRKFIECKKIQDKIEKLIMNRRR